MNSPSLGRLIWHGLAVAASLLSLTAPVAFAEQQPLHARIDARLNERLSQDLPGAVSNVASDAEFLRRVCLSLTGMPPSPERLRSFLADTSPNKRGRAIDDLLGSPQCDRHLATILDVMLMERRGNADSWRAYLLKSVQDNKPFNVFAGEILSADGADPQHGAAVQFYLERDAEPHLLARDVGRIFFGRDVQCAQCHDHPSIDDYRQFDYHGLLAFFTPGYIFTKDKETFYAERSGAEVKFESVFIKGTKHITAARVPDGAEIVEPVFYPGDETQSPAGKGPPVLKFSRRAKLAESVAGGANRSFNENIANRLWAMMMGRGLVDPVDLRHSANPPSDPELLTMLGKSFAAMKFDVKAFLKELALTEAYQRSIDLPSTIAESDVSEDELAQRIVALEAKAEKSTGAFDQALEAYAAAEAAMLPLAGELEQARAKAVEANKNRDEAAKALADASDRLAAKQREVSTLSEASAKAQEAVKAFAKDAEIAAAAKTFADKLAKFQAEVAPLQKVVEEKTAALKAPTEAVAAARQAFEAVAAKLKPLREAVAQKDEALVATRRQMIHDRTAAESATARRQKVAQLASYQDAKEKQRLAQQTAEARREEFASANKAAADYLAVVAEKQTQFAGAQTAQTAAAQAMSAAVDEQARRQAVVDAIEAARQSTESLREKLPDDPTLAEIAAQLNTKLTEFTSTLNQHAEAVKAADAAVKGAEQQAASARAAMIAAQAEMQQRQQAVTAAQKASDEAQASVEQVRMTAGAAEAELVKPLTSSAAVRPLQPLTAEQMCWSVLRVTGVYDRYWAAEAAELEKTSPRSEEDKKDPAKAHQRNMEIEQRVFEKLLKGNAAPFVNVYAAAAGQPQSDFFASADQALFVANGGQINSWIAPAADNVSHRMMKETDPAKAAEELYLTVLSRRPSAAEAADVSQYLATRKDDQVEAVKELVWGLLTSVEFRFNH